jgi:hypothetical protein
MQFVGPGLSAAGGAFKAIGALQGAGAEAATDNATAIAQEQAGRTEANVDAAKGAQYIKQGRAQAATARAAAGGSGAAASGSIMDDLVQSRPAAEQDAVNQYYQGTLAIDNSSNAAAFSRVRAKQAIAAGNSAAFSAILGGLTNGASAAWGG